MALNIISNLAANVAQRNLAATDSALTNSLGKLASGSRIVSARDDAASLAIGSRLRAEVAALKTAQANTGQAASMLQIADGALATIGDILVRMKSLAVQASSGQLGSIERGVLDSEFQALTSEISRIALDTEFNGTQLIAGSSAVVTQQEGTTGGLGAEGYTATFDTSTVATGDAFRVSFDNAGTSTQNLTVTNLNTGDQQTINLASSLDSVVTARGGTAGTTDLAVGETVALDFTALGVTITLDNNFVRATDNITLGTISAATSGSLFDSSGQLAGGLNSFSGLTVTFDNDGGVTDSILTLLNALASGLYNSATGELTINLTAASSDSAEFASLSGSTLKFSLDGGSVGTDTGDVTNAGSVLAHTIGIFIFDAAASTDVKIATIDFTNAISAGSVDGSIDIDFGHLLFSQTQTGTSSTTTFTFKVGSGNDVNAEDVSFVLSTATASALAVADDLITTVANATTASTAITAAIDTVNQQRADVGAAQNRLAFANSNLAIGIENQEAARSTLLDLDVASEISVFTSKQVLLQAGISMLAQANQIPQNLLRLLQ